MFLEHPIRPLFGVAALLALQAFVLFLFGQPPICTCGYVKVWEGVVLSSGNSQHLIDGFIFYVILYLLFPRMSVWQRLLIATGIEVAWEITENTPMVIQHYREQALSQGYVGDSIINSVSDSMAMIVGFVLAWRLPAWATIAIAMFLEVL